MSKTQKIVSPIMQLVGNISISVAGLLAVFIMGDFESEKIMTRITAYIGFLALLFGSYKSLVVSRMQRRLEVLYEEDNDKTVEKERLEYDTFSEKQKEELINNFRHKQHKIYEELENIMGLDRSENMHFYYAIILGSIAAVIGIYLGM